MDANNYETIYKNNFVNNKEFELGVCYLDEGLMQESNDYKQVFNCAESYLKKRHESGEDKFDSNYHVLNNFRIYVGRNREEKITNTWGDLASAFLLLAWYSLRIIRAPWRKTYFKIKTYAGHFQHSMYSNFSPPIVEELMAKMGYIYHRQQQTFLFHQQSLSSPEGWRNTLMLVGMDFFLVHVHCSLACTKTGRSMPVQNIFDAVGSSYSTNVSSLQNEQDVILRSPVISTAENTLPLKRHTSNVQLKSSVARSNSDMSRTGNMQEYIATYPRKTKKSNRPTDSNWSRVEVIPNTYVPLPRTPKQSQGHPSSSRAESSRGSVPWEHRMGYSLKHKNSLSSRQKISSPPQYSDDSDDMSLYEGRDVIEPSIADGKICYPPREDSFTKSLNISDNYEPGPSRYVSRESHNTKRTNSSKHSNSSRETFDNSQKDDNYVIARPIQKYDNTQLADYVPPSREDRVESGYYSQWISTSKAPFLKTSEYSRELYPIYPGYSKKKVGAMSGYDNVVPVVDKGKGDYVRTFSPKRSPADGRSEPVTHIYHEIPQNRWGGTSTATGSSTSAKPKLKTVYR